MLIMGTMGKEEYFNLFFFNEGMSYLVVGWGTW